MSDNNIKSKLEEREIQPTTNAWDRLDAQLSNHEESETTHSQPKRYFYWIGIAASVVLFIAINFYLNRDSTIQTENPTITQINIPSVETITDTVEAHQHINKLQESSPSKTQLEMASTVTPSEALTPTSANKKTSKTVAKEQVIELNPEQPYSNNNSEEVIAHELNPTIKQDSNRIDELLSADELLEQALKKRQINQEQSIAVDSRQLLNAVEDDIFQEKSPDLLEKLTQQIKSIQVALNERNKEK